MGHQRFLCSYLGLFGNSQLLNNVITKHKSVFMTAIVVFSGVMIGNVLKGHPIEQVEEESSTL